MRTGASVGRCEHELSILVKETPEHLWCSPKLNTRLENRETISDKLSFRITESVFQSDFFCLCNHHGDESQSVARQVCGGFDNIYMTTLNNFDDTQTTMDGPRSTTNTDERESPTDPLITQDSCNSSEGEWSVLAKQTPDDFWCSPVVKVVDSSL